MALPSLRHQHPASGSWRSSKPGTAPTPASRTGSGTPKTPASAGSRPASSPSTRPGCRSSPIAADLTAWLRLLALDGDLAAAEPKALRYRLLHVPARLTRGGRRRRLRLPATGPGPTRSSRRSAAITAIPAPT